MLKFATAEILSAHTSAHGMPALARTAHRADFSHHQVRPGYLYVRSRAISSRCNDNFDEFPAEEISKAYKTFIGKPVFVNHVNHDTARARGVCIDAALHRDRNPDGTPDVWVEVLMEVDGIRFPKLAKAILAKPPQVYETSMGCDVDYSICSACGNKATRPEEYCRHIPGSKGTSYSTTDHKTGARHTSPIREICYGLRFFENSLLVEAPADPTAQLLGVDATGLGKTAGTTARYTTDGPQCSRCHHAAGTGPGCPKCDATKVLKDALGDLDLGGEGHNMAWQYRDAGPTLHGTCRNCGRTTELGAPGMRGDNTGQPPAHKEPCVAMPDRAPDMAEQFAHTTDYLPDHPGLPPHLNTRTAGYDPYGEWDGQDDDEEREQHAKNWDDIHEYLGDIHRGIGVHLRPEDHAIVHDPNRSTAERAAHLLKTMPRPHLSGENSVGWHWSGNEGVAEDFAHRSYDPAEEKAGRPATAVVFHAHKPDRDAIDETPDHSAGEVYGYHDHGEQEVPIHQGATLALRGISWKNMDASPAAAQRAGYDPDDFFEPKGEDFTHHEFGGHGHYVQARKLYPRTAASTDGYITCDHGHRHWGTAGAAGKLIHHDGHVLLGLRADWVQHGGTWGIPGGALHEGEDPEEGAHREATEELGDLPDLHHTHTHTDDHGGWKYSTVVAEAPHRFDPEGGDGETDEFAWVHPRDFHKYDLHPGFAASWPRLAPHVRGGATPRTAAAEDTSYRFLHTAPDSTGVPLHRLLHPSSANTLGSMQNSSPADEETGDAIEAANGRPRARIKIYRAVPSHVTTINPGDWVALSSRFARDFAEHRKDHHVIATTAEARHIHTDGNDASEWGYNGPAKNGRIHWKRPVRPVRPDYAGGAVQLSDEDHDFVHGTAPVAERAHRLMQAIPRNKDDGPYTTGAMHRNKGSYTDDRSEAHYDAQDNADQLPHGDRPPTLFMLHAPQNSRAITGVSFTEHTPPETPLHAYTHHTWTPTEVDEDTGMRHTAKTAQGTAWWAAYNHQEPTARAARRVQAMPPRHSDPAEHPFFKEHPVSAAHVVAHWADATPEEKNQGERWYSDAHLLAHALAHTYAGGDTGKAAGVISAYSPRTSWAANMHNAARSLASGKALGVGEGLSIMGMHHGFADRIMNGEDYDKVLKAPKTNAFAKLIHHGGIDPHTGRPMPHVVIDRHALSVAAGQRLSEDDAAGFPSSTPHYYNHVAKTYSDAADAISKTEGRTVAPHQVQAVTWLVRIRHNQEEDRNLRGGGGKGRVKNQENQLNQWRDLHPKLLPGGAGPDNMHMSNRTGARRRVKAMGDGSYRMMHQAPDEESGEPLHEVWGEDPDELRTMYRAVPRHITEINKGDWVTLHPEYAHQHALELEPGRRHGHVLQAQVPLRHLHTDHNDENEIGYNGPDLHNVDTHEHPDFPETMHSDEDDDEPQGTTNYAGGAVHLNAEDHAFVHNPAHPVAERAHRLMQAVPYKYEGSYSALGHHTGYWDEDPDMAQIDAEDRADKLGDTGSHPATQYVLHSPEHDDRTTGVSWAEHGPEKYFHDFTHHTWPASEVDADTGLRKHASDDDGDYRMQHQVDPDFGSPLHDPTRDTFPKDVYEHPEWYSGAPDAEMMNSLRRAKGEPEKKIRIYRGVPQGVQHINTGDWVTLSKAYAKQHVESNVPGGHVLRVDVPAKHIISGGDDLQEWGYHGPQRIGMSSWVPKGYKHRYPWETDPNWEKNSKLAYGETKAPAQVDTLRDDACDVCGNKEGWDGQSCPVCQYMQVPDNFRDPDTGVARTMDLRGDAAAQEALQQGADAVPGGTDAAGDMLPGGDPAQGQLPGGVAEGPGGEMEDPQDATADGEVRTLGDGAGDPAAQEAEGQTDAQVPGGDGQMSPSQLPPGAQDVLTCPACGYQTPAGAPVSTITADPSIPASAGPVAGDVCPNCGKATLVSAAEEAGLTPPPEVAAIDPEAADVQGAPPAPGEEPQDPAQAPEEDVPEEEDDDEPQAQSDDGAKGKPKSPAVKRVA